MKKEGSFNKTQIPQKSKPVVGFKDESERSQFGKSSIDSQIRTVDSVIGGRHEQSQIS